MKYLNEKKAGKIIFISALIICIILLNPLGSYADIQGKTGADSVKSSDGSFVKQNKGKDIVERLSKGSIGWKEKGIQNTGDIVKFALFWLLVLFIGIGIFTYFWNYYFKGKDSS